MTYRRLDELCTDIIDCPHTTPKWQKDGICVIRNFNLRHGRLDFSDGYYVDEETYRKRIKRANPEEGDIVLSREAPVGGSALIPKGLKCCLGQRLVLLKVNRRAADSGYLIFALQSEQVLSQLKRAGNTGSIVSGICISDLKEIQIPMLSHGMREATRLFADINEKININSEQYAVLERQLNLIYKYWFARYEFPDKCGRPYKSSGGRMKYSDALGKEIPADWGACSLLEIADWSAGVQPPKSMHISEPRTGYVRLIQNRDYSDNSRAVYIPESHRNRFCGELDIMVDKYGCAGQTRFGLSGAYNVALGKVEVKRESMREYVRCFLSSCEVRDFLRSSGAASTRASLSEGNFSMLMLAVPPEDVLVRFERLAGAHIHKMLLLKKSTRRLEYLRDKAVDSIMSENAFFRATPSKPEGR